MEQSLVILGFVVILIGIFIIIVASLLGEEGEKRIHWGFGGFIGPIPFGFASERGILYVIITICVILFILYLLSQRIIW
jgi:uncharacterized membrane protein